MNYSEFAESIAESGCRKCDLHLTRKNIVVHRGNPDAAIILIGEAPGKEEDEQGRPFVGRSGKMLDLMFDEAGFNTNYDTLIINVLKCRPPDNRTPTDKEAHLCFPFLEKQIELSKASVIVALGKTAVTRIIPGFKKQKMNDVFGKLLDVEEFPGKKLLILFHPAYILRNRTKMPLMVQTIKNTLTQFK